MSTTQLPATPDNAENHQTIGGRCASDCSPGRELRPGYKIAFNDCGQVTRWRVLKIQPPMVLVTEGFGVHRIVPMAEIEAMRYIVEQTRFPWYLRPFYRENK